MMKPSSTKRDASQSERTYGGFGEENPRRIRRREPTAETVKRMSCGGGGVTDSSLVKLCFDFTSSSPQICEDNNETGRRRGGVTASVVYWDGGAAVQRWWGGAS
ncbi:unnamed protein product [Eruca vesicaria subsp. sativa]|uniref:Uncharacterized protein n=1 Tax=Eruca vesicaria subsp. sativa TaxID=29727 RepID=A0ABC8LXH7_ERUVS|nr:unnamed protein product [Eruca vesicaria subsp. sativa]